MIRKEMLWSTTKLVCIRQNETEPINDLKVIVTDPFGIDSVPINMIRVAQGYYVASFISQSLGYHHYRIASLVKPNIQYGGDFLVVNDWDNYFIANKQIYVGKVISSPVGSNKIHCNLFNNNSSQTVKILRVKVSNKTDSTATGHNIGLLLRRTSSSGIGTFGNFTKFISSAPTLGNIQFVFGFSSTPILISGSELSGCNLDTEESRSGLANDLFDFKKVGNPIVLAPNEGCCVQQDNYSSNGLINIFYYFTV